MRVPQLQASRVNSYVLGAVFAAVFVLFVLSFSRERDSSSSSSSSSVAPIEYEDSELGMLSIPKGLKKVLIDVGASTSPFPHEKDTLVVAVEPLLSSIYKGKYLDRSDVTVLPVVISEQEGLTTLFETKNSVSSSLNQPDGSNDVTTVVRRRLVPALRLERVIAAVPESVELTLCKSDAQGHDIEVIRSAGELIKRCTRVQVESQTTEKGFQLYGTNKNSKAINVAYMKTMGFTLEKALCGAEVDFDVDCGYDANLIFVNNNRH